MTSRCTTTALLFLFLLLIHKAFGGFEQKDLGARAAGLGGSFVGLSDDVWAIAFNPGGLSQLKRREVSFFYSPQPFGLSELSTGAVAVALPINVGVIGAAARKYGFDLYREVSGTVSYSNTLSSVGVGINLNYHSVSISKYGSAGTIGIDVGIIIKIFDQLHWGMTATNINSPTIGVSNEKLPQSFSAGLAYVPLKNLTFALDYHKQLKFDPSPRFGFEYWIVEVLAIRSGVSDAPSQYAGGAGIRYSMFQIDYAFITHQELGGTHQVSISLRWGGSSE
ncbi:MAG: hypothetical protein HY707_01180 [Ignavibacteriae bacterium]|nr:hypothetical protein [Ignavibacteriota bacterium]